MIKKSILFLLSIIIIAACASKKSSPPTNQGKIVFTLGKVFINKNEVKTGTILKHGDTIETKANSACDIIVGKKNIFRIKSNSRVIYKISNDEGQLEVQKGWLAGVIKNKKIFSKNKFSINTPTMVAGVRGTSFCLKVENPKSTYFCTCNGTIALRDSKNGQDHSVTASHHKAERFTLSDTGKIAINKSPGMHYHGDAELNELAAKIHVKIDWNKADK